MPVSLIRSFGPATKQSSLAALSRPNSASAPILSIAFAVSTMIQRRSSSGASVSSSASSTSRISRGVFTLGSRIASGLQALAASRSSVPHSLASELTRMTHSGPPGRRAREIGAQVFARRSLRLRRNRILQIEDHGIAIERRDLGDRLLVRSRNEKHRTARAFQVLGHLVFLPGDAGPCKPLPRGG